VEARGVGMSNVRLTARGERLLLSGYAVAKVTGALGGILLLMGVAGWIEGM
jgi:hypothetical protein